MAMKTSKLVLPIIVFSQFCGTSLWFASNAVIADIASSLGLGTDVLGHLTSAVQLGFIVGTLVFAVLSIADRFSPSKVFFVSSTLGALCNLGTVLDGNSLYSLLSIRFATGFFLAGIYPVGMKIASDYFQSGLGKSLGFLVGALVLGTAFPHLLKSFEFELPWKMVLYVTSALAFLGGLFILLGVPDGPHRKQGQKLAPMAIFQLFKNPPFRAAAFGYFGHMWELYAFWAFVPICLQAFHTLHPALSLNVSLLSFLTIAIGAISCVLGGYLSVKKGSKRVATWALMASGLCCMLSSAFMSFPVLPLFMAFLLFWGMVVIADSPLFSTLVAQNAPAELKGTALTLVNSIGFALSIVSIQWLNSLQAHLDPRFLFLPLAIGPVLGTVFLLRNKPE